jgi:hypothetical protein
VVWVVQLQQQAQARSIAEKFGWTAPDPKTSPLNVASDLFKQGLESFGLNDVKDEINKAIKEQTDLENKKADEASEVNANPWLTEGERINRLKKVDEKYETKLDILINKQKLYQAQYDSGLDQVQWQVGQTMQAYNNAQQDNNDIFKQALSIAEKEVAANNALAKNDENLAAKTVKVGKETYQYNPETQTYEPVSTSGGGTGTGTGTTTSTTKFSTAQINKGASNAGLPVTTFKSLPDDVKNVFINNADTAKNLVAAVAGVKDGAENAKDVIDEINASNLPQPVKDYFISSIQAIAPVAEATNSSGFKVSNILGNPFGGQGFGSNLKSALKDLFGN